MRANNSRSKQRKEKRRQRRKLIIILISLFVLLVGGAYGLIGYYFTSHFLPRTRIDGRDVGRRTLKEAQGVMDRALMGYRLTVHEENNLDEEITCEQAGLTYTNFEMIEKWLKEQEWYKWPLFYMTNESVTYNGLTYSVDQDKVFARVDELSCMHPAEVVESVSANIRYNENSEAYEVVPESIGNVMEVETFKADILKAIQEKKDSISIVDKTYYKKPKYLSDSKEIQDAIALMNGYLQATVTYEDRNLSAALTKDQIAGFLKWSKDFKVTIDREKINAYIEKTLSSVFNTVGKQRTFDSKGSGRITMGGGNYGWRVGIRLETDAIEKGMKAKKAQVRSS